MTAQDGFHSLGAVRRAPGGDDPQEWRFVAEDGSQVRVALLADDLARVRLAPVGVESARSWAVVRDEPEWPIVKALVATEPGALSLTTPAMRVEIGTAPFRVAFHWPDDEPFADDDAELGMGLALSGGAQQTNAGASQWTARCVKRLAPGERILGAGLRTSGLDVRGVSVENWNTDPPQPHGSQTGAMYSTIPFWIGLRDGHAYGVFLDSVCESELDFGVRRADRLIFSVAGGDLTYYLFAGPTPAAVLARYADLTGHMPLPPRWALGYGQSRWSYFHEEQVRDIATQFRSRRIPCDALWFDIDYMDGYRVFTWNPQRFPDPHHLLEDLHSQGFQPVTIIDPGVKVDPTDPTYADGLARDYFVRNADGTVFNGNVWPGASAFPDFSRADVRHWWGERHRGLLEGGVAAVWDDMNEPSLTDRFAPEGDTPRGSSIPPDALHHPDGPGGQPIPHSAFHNAYGMQMARATHEGLARLRPGARPFVLSRSGYAGIQRYAALWTGDNMSSWEHLRLAARMCLTLGLSGVPHNGFDTGGFWGNATGEMLVRFTQLGAMFPFFRNHSAMMTSAQEPWAFGQPYESFCRQAIELRYRLLPYLYTAFAEAARTGAPITRPLVYAYPEDLELADVDDEALLGPNLLAAPVMEENEPKRYVRFPRGAWVDWLTGERIVGPARRLVDSPLDVLPLYAREGSIISLGPVIQYVGERPEDPVTLACYLGPMEPGATPATDDVTSVAEGTLYEDDGRTPAYTHGAWRETRFVAQRRGSQLTLSAQTQGNYGGGLHEWLVELHIPHAGGERPTVRAARVASTAAPSRHELGPAHKPTAEPTERAHSVTMSERIGRRYETVLRIPIGRAAAPFIVTMTVS